MAGESLTDPGGLDGRAAEALVDRVLAANGDEAFLRAAYQLTLGRGIDGEGLRFYTAHMRKGAKRPDVVWELASSEEGRAHLARDADVKLAIAQRTGRRRTRVATVAELLALPTAGFVEACMEIFSRSLPGKQPQRRLQLALASGKPRFEVLRSLADGSGRQVYPELQGFDEYLAQARNSLFPVAGSVAEMLTYVDEAFVDCAYKTLLGRAPDASGATYYLGRLQQGFSQTSVIEALARSTEARLRHEAPSGLRSMCFRYWLCRVMLHPRWAARLLQVESDHASHRRLRRMEALARRISGLELRQLEESGALAAAPTPSPQATFDLEALLDIQRDNFERETLALRKLVAQILSMEKSNAGPPRRLIGRRRRVARR